MQTVPMCLVEAHLHELDDLKAACINFIKASMNNSHAVMMSDSYIELKKTYPLIWKDLRAAMGLPEEKDEEVEEKKDDDDNEEEGQDKKRARHE